MKTRRGINTENVMGKIINIQHFSLDDGPGIRTAVFLKGCPLRCAWCHNPEALDTRRELMYRAERCRGCGACAEACSLGLHHMENGRHLFERNGCVRCGRCSDVCAFEALEMVGQEVTVGEILEDILLDRVFYQRSGGGITISGGEPLAQSEFTVALLAACKQEGLHTAVETCGYGSVDALLRVNEYTDLFLYDYKLTDDTLHKQYTGVSNRFILENLAVLCENGAKVILRCPMIPDVNMETRHFDGIALMARQFSNIQEIQLEPYHPLGVGKAVALGKKAVYDRGVFGEKSQLTEVQEYIQEKVTVPVRIL